MRKHEQKDFLKVIKFKSIWKFEFEISQKKNYMNKQI